MPGVGEDLQDHLAAHVQHTCTQPVTFGVLREKRNWPSIGAQWLLGHSGPGSTNIFEAGGFVKTRPEMTIPDVSNIGAKPRRVVHSRVVSTELL